MKKKIAIITTHPVQYYAPLFRKLSMEGTFDFKIYYTWGNVGETKYDPGFGKSIEWDIPLLEGYSYTFVKNTAINPGSSHFKGIDNPTLIQEIENWKADAVLIYGWSYKSHLKALRYFKGKIPVFFRGDSTLLDNQGWFKTQLRRIFLSWVYSYIDYAFYVGLENKRYYQFLGLKEKQLFFAPHSVNNERFYENETEYEQQAKKWKQELGIPLESKTVLFAGKFEPKKNPLLLLSIAQMDKYKHIHFIFVGNGILESELKSVAQRDTNIHILPFQNQSKMPIVYRLGDIFCLPSQGPGETWGLAVNEAMACKRTILVSNKCGCAIDLVTDENGRVFDALDIKNFESKIDQILQFKDKRAGENSLNHIANYSITISATKIIDHLKSILGCY